MKRFLIGYRLFSSDILIEYEVAGESVIEVSVQEGRLLAEYHRLPIFSIKVEELD